MRVVIMAGGKGTRVASLDSEVPKPMLKVAGKPVLEHQIDCLKSQGYYDITLVIGYKGNVIRDYFGSSVRYIEEESSLGTAGALYYLKDIRDDFLLLNGDIIFDVDLNRFARYHKNHGGLITLLTHPNNHPFDSGVVVAGENGEVVGWLAKEDKRGWYKNRVNAGIHMLSSGILERFSRPERIDLDRDILMNMVGSGSLFAYDSPEYVKDMGTPERFMEAERDIISGKVTAKNLKNKQRASFFDRDGTINKYVGFLRDIEDFDLIESAVEMIKNANDRGDLVIVVTNQPVIARGEVSWDELKEIHNKMETLLGRRGAYVDDIFICPHHPDSGFAGEISEYKILCGCRKPKPGLFYQAAEKYNISLERSVMFGDSESDKKAAAAAGVKFCAAGDALNE